MRSAACRKRKSSTFVNKKESLLKYTENFRNGEKEFLTKNPILREGLLERAKKNHGGRTRANSRMLFRRAGKKSPHKLTNQGHRKRKNGR